MEESTRALKIGLYVPRLRMAVHFAAAVLVPGSAHLGQVTQVAEVLGLPAKIGDSCDHLIERLEKCVNGADSVADAEQRILRMLRPDSTSFVVTQAKVGSDVGGTVDSILDEAVDELTAASDKLDLIDEIESDSKQLHVPIGSG